MVHATGYNHWQRSTPNQPRKIDWKDMFQKDSLHLKAGRPHFRTYPVNLYSEDYPVPNGGEVRHRPSSGSKLAEQAMP